MNFTSLSQFYNSDKWRNFRLYLIESRKSKKDGLLYSEFSGNPIANGYDIVAHHIQPLTMANVNDFSVSLNPDNIMLLSQAEHNEVHKRFGYCTERKVYYVYGAPCSGKTTFVRKIKGNSDVILDIDSIWESITGVRYEKPAALKPIAFQIRDNLFDMIRTRAGKWERAYVIDGGASPGERSRKIALLGAEPIYIDTSKGECLARLANDKTRTPQQREEWRGYIEKWFLQYQP